MGVDFSKILKKDKGLFLAYDQGLEHGPNDFNLDNVDPNYILEIGKKAKFNAVILQKGTAEKYYGPYEHDIPLILKLNGKTRIPDIEPISSQLCSVKYAVKLGASAVGYTIYDGSGLEPEIFKDFGRIQEEAHDFGLPVIAWIYPRGSFIKNENSTDVMAYSCRIGLELGADLLKIRYNGDIKGFEWAVKCAGRAKVFVAGGFKTGEKEFLQMAKDVLNAGAGGLAVGRNVWQHPQPLKISEALKQVIFDNKPVDEALKKLQ